MAAPPIVSARENTPELPALHFTLSSTPPLICTHAPLYSLLRLKRCASFSHIRRLLYLPVCARSLLFSRSSSPAPSSRESGGFDSSQPTELVFSFLPSTQKRFHTFLTSLYLGEMCSTGLQVHFTPDLLNAALLLFCLINSTVL